jgi:hypothetical protein
MNMMQVGHDVTIPDLQRQKVKRVKRGECPECGTKLFKTATGMLGRMKKATPINEAGKCLNGRCLICFPLNKVEEEEAAKKLPIPRIVLTCQTKGLMGPNGMMNEDGTIQDNTGIGCFGLDFDDEVSAITLDRRIRTEVEEIDNVGHSPSKSVNRSQAAMADSFSKIILLTENSDKSLRARMEEFLKEEHTQIRNTMMTSVPDDEDDEDEMEIDSKLVKWEAPPEQAPPRKTKKEDTENEEGMSEFAINECVVSTMGKITLEEKSGGRQTLQGRKAKSDLKSELAQAKPRRKSEVILQRHFSESGSAAKKLFHPSTMFVPPSTEEDSVNKSNIILEEPDEGDTKAEEESNCEAKEHDKSNTATSEIFFDSAAHLSNVEKVPIKLEGKEQVAGPLSGTGEVSSGSEQESLEAFGPESCSSHNLDTDEYGAYSSKLLMMLDPKNESDGETERFVAGGAKQPFEYLPGIQFGAVLSHSLGAGTSDIRILEGPKKAQHKTEDTIPTTADSSQVPSDDGTTPHGSDIPELLDEPVSPKGDDSGLMVAPMSPKKKPPPGPKLAPNTPIEGPASPKKPPPPLTQMMMESVSDLKKPAHDMPPHDIPMLLSQLQNGRTEGHESTLVQLTDCLWEQGSTAKQQFLANNGIKVLAATMWADMMVPRAERAAAELFLALVTTTSPTAAASSSSKSATGELRGNDETEGLIDALLISMQTLIMDEDLQQVGCRILCCLASSSNGNDNDGTQSGACLAVLNAMDTHYNSEVVQEWGLRALYNQCVYSKHAETNKRTLLCSKLDTTGATGGDVLERMILSGAYHLKDGGVLEWACRLCWCLTASNASVAEMVALRMDTLRELLHILEQCRAMEDASPQLQEAVLGMIANLLRMNQYKPFLGTSDVILLILDVMHGNKEFVEVQIEACSVIANTAGLLSPLEKEEIVDAGAVRTIVGAMFAFPRDKAALQEPALRALVGLALDSEIANEDICEHETLSVLMHLCRLDESSTLAQQEIFCNLLASLYASERSMPKALQCDSLRALTSAVAAYRNSEKIQDAACFAYRNLSKSMGILDTLIRCNAIDFAVSAMLSFRLSKTIQSNACCALWNIGVGTEFGHQKIAETKAINCIVNAIQTHMDAQEVIEVACGALWGLIHRSHILRQQFFDNANGVESVTCTLVMHPRSTALLEMACGVLAFTSTNARGAAAVVVADGVSNVVETMRNNPKSINILQHGAHFLRNTIIRNHNYVGEATGVIPVLINGLKDFRADTFLSEACNFIWTISELSYDAKSKIIAMEGIPILMAILDQKGGNAFVEVPALGAFKELALEPSARG